MLKGWKTFLGMLLAAVLPVLEALDVTNVLGETGTTLYTIGVAGLGIALRVITDTPIFQNK